MSMAPDEINALPDRVRAYIHELEADADPSGDRRELILLRDQNQQLQRLIEEQRIKDEVCQLFFEARLEVVVAELYERKVYRSAVTYFGDDCVFLMMCVLAQNNLVEQRQNPLGGSVFRINGKLYGHTQGITPDTFGALKPVSLNMK